MCQWMKPSGWPTGSSRTGRTCGLLADSVGLALLVVVQALTPAERLAFVLHDMFAVPHGQVAAIIRRTPNAARLLASRARRRVRAAATTPDPDVTRQRQVVDAFFAASRAGDLDALIALLAPDVVVRADYGATPAGASRQVRGAPTVARQALSFSRLIPLARPVLVNGTAGVVVARDGRAFTIMGFTVRHEKITEIDILADPARIRRLGLTVPGWPGDGALRE